MAPPAPHTGRPRCRQPWASPASPRPATPVPPTRRRRPSRPTCDRLPCRRADGPARCEDEPVPLGLLDDPDGQRQVPAGWDPRQRQPARLRHGRQRHHDHARHGRAVGRARVRARPAAPARAGPRPRRAAPLAELPHCGAVVTAREPERRQRLQAWLLAEADRRRQLSHDELGAEPLQVVVVDGLRDVARRVGRPRRPTTEYDAAPAAASPTPPRLRMAFVGQHHAARVPLRSAVASAVAQRLVHRLADPNDSPRSGCGQHDVPPCRPGVPCGPADGTGLQVARAPDLPAAVAQVAAAGRARGRPPTAVARSPNVARLVRCRGRGPVARGAGGSAGRPRHRRRSTRPAGRCTPATTRWRSARLRRAGPGLLAGLAALPRRRCGSSRRRRPVLADAGHRGRAGALGDGLDGSWRPASQRSSSSTTPSTSPTPVRRWTHWRPRVHRCGWSRLHARTPCRATTDTGCAVSRAPASACSCGPSGRRPGRPARCAAPTHGTRVSRDPVAAGSSTRGGALRPDDRSTVARPVISTCAQLLFVYSHACSCSSA